MRRASRSQKSGSSATTASSAGARCASAGSSVTTTTRAPVNSPGAYGYWRRNGAPTQSSRSYGSSAARSRGRSEGRCPANSRWSCGNPARAPKGSCHTGQSRRSARAVSAVQVPSLSAPAPTTRAGAVAPASSAATSATTDTSAEAARRSTVGAGTGRSSAGSAQSFMGTRTSAGPLPLAGGVHGPPDRAGHVLGAYRRLHPDRVVPGQALQPPGEERLLGEVPAVLLADQDHQGRPVRRGRWPAHPPRCRGPPWCAAAPARARSRASAQPVAAPTTEPSCRARTNSRSSGRSVSRDTSVEPGLAKRVVSPCRRSTSKAASRTVRDGYGAMAVPTALARVGHGTCPSRARLATLASALPRPASATAPVSTARVTTRCSFGSRPDRQAPRWPAATRSGLR